MNAADDEGASVAEGVGRRDESGRGKSSLRVGVFGPAEEQDVRLWTMQLVVSPSAGLLDAECAPLLNGERVTDSVRSLPRGIFL